MDDSVVRTNCSFRGHGFDSQHPHDGLPPSVTLVPGNSNTVGSRHIHRKTYIQAEHPSTENYFK